ncbi:MAG: ribonuclease Z [Lachnospiraceae bacterium]|nr:ribonuclease Z [Lachnospiraceae bacterium]
MLDVCLLGTAGMMPLPNRWLTSLLTRYNGSNILIDCGEGTQIALKESGWSPNPIDVILFTHFHADHISGLPGMLLSMANADRVEPVLLVGPRGLEKVVRSLLVIAGGLPFELNFRELKEKNETIVINGYTINAFKVNHNVPCYGYSISISRLGKFDATKAKELNIPVNLWNRLQHGGTVEFEGNIYQPDMVMGPERKGLKVTYSTDSRPCEAIVNAAKESDLFICEGMYGEKDKLQSAKEKKHMTFYEAAKLAKEAKVEELWLTHFSPSLMNPKHYMNEVREIFKNSHLGKDNMKKELAYKEEENE